MTKRILLFLFLASVSLSLSAQKHYSVKMIKADKKIMVPADIEGYKIKNFIFDTGSTTTVLLEEDLVQLKRRGIVSEKNRKPDCYLRGYEEKKILFKSYVVPSLTIGNMRIRNVEIIFNSVSHFRLLGQNVMKLFDKISINYKANTIDFEK